MNRKADCMWMWIHAKAGNRISVRNATMSLIDVYKRQVYANGRLEQLQDMKITDIGLYSESCDPLNICITSMEFEDDGRLLKLEAPILHGNIVCQNESDEVISC